MACCLQATSHYLHPWWQSSMSPHGITRPRWVRCALLCYYEWFNTSRPRSHSCKLLECDQAGWDQFVNTWRPEWNGKHQADNDLIPLASTKLKVGYTGFTLSICYSTHPSICLSVDWTMSALYLPQYSLDLFNFMHLIKQFQKMCLVCVCCKITKFEFLAFFLIFNFDFVLCPCHWNVKVDSLSESLLQPLWIFCDDAFKTLTQHKYRDWAKLQFYIFVISFLIVPFT